MTYTIGGFPAIPVLSVIIETYHLKVAIDGDIQRPVVAAPPRHGLPLSVATDPGRLPPGLVRVDGDVLAPDLGQDGSAAPHGRLQEDVGDLQLQLLRAHHLEGRVYNRFLSS